MQDDDPRYDTKGAAAYLKVKPATMVWWRHIGRGPEYEKPAGRVTYRQSQLDRFREAGVVKPCEAA